MNSKVISYYSNFKADKLLSPVFLE